MKKTTLVLALLLCVSTVANAQFWNQKWSNDYENESAIDANWTYTATSKLSRYCWENPVLGNHFLAIVDNYGGSRKGTYKLATVCDKFASATNYRFEMDFSLYSSNSSNVAVEIYNPSNAKVLSVIAAKNASTAPAAVGSTSGTVTVGKYATGTRGKVTGLATWYHATIWGSEKGTYVTVEEWTSDSTKTVVAGLDSAKYSDNCEILSYMTASAGKNFGAVGVDNMVLYYNEAFEEVVAPTAEITDFDGITRTVTISQALGFDIFYAADSAAFAPYTDPVVIEKTTEFKMYAVSKLGTHSDTASVTLEAGTAIQLKAPTYAKTAYQDSCWSITFASDQSSVFQKPTAQVIVTQGEKIDTIAAGTAFAVGFGHVSARVCCAKYTDSEPIEFDLAKRADTWLNWEATFNKPANSRSLLLDSVNTFAVDGTTYYPFTLHSSTVGDTTEYNKRLGLATATDWLNRNNDSGLYPINSNHMLGLKGLKPGQKVLFKVSNANLVNSVPEALVLNQDESAETELIYDVVEKGNFAITTAYNNYYVFTRIAVLRTNEIEECNDPEIVVSKVDGTTRTVSIKQDDNDSIFYSTGEAFAAYTEPIVISQTTAFQAYAKNDFGTKSDTVENVIEAGVTVQLNAPTITRNDYDYDTLMYTVTLKADQNSILCQPEASIVYTIASDSSLVTDTVVSGTTLYLAKGTLSAWTTAEGYDNSETASADFLAQPIIATGWSINFLDSAVLTHTSYFMGDTIETINGTVYRRLHLGSSVDTLDMEERFCLAANGNWLMRNDDSKNAHGFYQYSSGNRNIGLLGLKEGQVVKITSNEASALGDGATGVLLKNDSKSYGNTVVYDVINSGNEAISVVKNKYIYKVEVGFEEGKDNVGSPSAAITGVDGTKRTVTIARPDYDKVYFKAEADTAYVLYSKPFEISEKTTFLMYAQTDGGLQSQVISETIDAGTEIQLAGVGFKMMNYDEFMEMYTIGFTTDQSKVLCTPTVTINYSIEAVTGSCLNGDSLQTTSGMLKAYASAPGYANSITTVLPITDVVSELPAYLLSTETYTETVESAWNFSNGFSISSSKGYSAGNKQCVKFSRNVQFTINVPANVKATGIYFKGYTNSTCSDNSKSWIGELQGETLYQKTDDKTSEAYQNAPESFPGNDTEYLAEYVYDLKEAQIGGTITFTVYGSSQAGLIVGIYGEEVALAQSVSLDKKEAGMEVGDTLTLLATVLPEDAINKNVSWQSSDTTVAVVENGVVKALAAGNAVITVTTEYGQFSDSCTVTVQLKDALNKIQAEGEEMIFDLQGRRMTSRPTAKGIYLINGKKVLVK